jgi:hypothetical protein
MMQTFRTLAPTGRTQQSSASVAPIGDLNGKVVVELWDYLFKGDLMLEVIRAELLARFPGLTLLPYTAVGNIHGTDETEVVAGIPAFLREHGCDGAITLVAC